ncbi:hypothetical protein KO507_18560 [Gilvimarinus agarilyticus]|nr:hypothetical protein [Gilvimarinus agarilyticus]
MFYQGFLSEVPSVARHDAATCFLVSQFILPRAERTQFFHTIADRLQPNGLLISVDLAAEITSPEFDLLLRGWVSMTSGKITESGVARMRNTYTNHVGVLPPSEVSSLIAAGGFENPLPFFQAGLMHGWLARRVGF